MAKKSPRTPRETEASVLHGIRAALTARGWRIRRMGAMIYGKSGIADLLCMKDGLTVWVECKNPARGKLSQAQRDFGYEVEAAGGVYIVARSVDYAVGICEGLVIHCPGKDGDGGVMIKPVKGMRVIAERQE